MAVLPFQLYRTPAERTSGTGRRARCTARPGTGTLPGRRPGSSCCTGRKLARRWAASAAGWRRRTTAAAPRTAGSGSCTAPTGGAVTGTRGSSGFGLRQRLDRGALDLGDGRAARQDQIVPDALDAGDRLDDPGRLVPLGMAGDLPVQFGGAVLEGDVDGVVFQAALAQGAGRSDRPSAGWRTAPLAAWRPARTRPSIAPAWRPAGGGNEGSRQHPPDVLSNGTLNQAPAKYSSYKANRHRGRKQPDPISARMPAGADRLTPGLQRLASGKTGSAGRDRDRRPREPACPVVPGCAIQRRSGGRAGAPDPRQPPASSPRFRRVDPRSPAGQSDRAISGASRSSAMVSSSGNANANHRISTKRPSTPPNDPVVFLRDLVHLALRVDADHDAIHRVQRRLRHPDHRRLRP